MKKLLICCLATILSESVLISCGSTENTPNKDSNSVSSEEKPENNESENKPSKEEPGQNKDNGITDEKPKDSAATKKVLDEFVSKFKEKDYIPMPLERKENEIKDLYFNNLGNIKLEDSVEDFALLETGRSPGVGFALILKAKPNKITEARQIATTVLEKKVNDAFYPDEKEIAQKAKVEVNGDYISLFILNDDIKEEAMKLYQTIVK